jgi:hypothetical protein
VEVWRLPAGGFQFLTALSRGSTMAQSAEAAMNDTPGFDLAVNLLDAKIAIAIW